MSPGGPRPRGPDGAITVYIGPKPTMSYVFEVVAQLNSGGGPVVVKARGHAIAKAVDVVEVVRHKFLDGAELGSIAIMTERLVNREGREANVSSIAIPIVRSAGAPTPPGPRPGTPEPSAAAPAE